MNGNPPLTQISNYVKLGTSVNAKKRKSMRYSVFRELPEGARQQQCAQKLVLEQPAEHALKQ